MRIIITNRKRFRLFMTILGLSLYFILAARAWIGESPELDLDSVLFTASTIILGSLAVTSRSR